MTFRDQSIGSDYDNSYEISHYGSHSINRRPAIVSAGTQQNMVLASLPADVRRMVEPLLKKVTLTKEQFIYQEDDRLDYIYFPETAVISEFKILEDGRTVEIAVTGKDGAIGLSSLYSESQRVPNFTQVMQSGTAQRLDATEFSRLLKKNDRLRSALSEYVHAYIGQISQKAICNMYHSVKERLCTWLLMVQDRCGRSDLKLTHDQMARTLGVYRPSVSFTTQELRESKLISYTRGAISIRDRKNLERAACSCYSEMCSLTPDLGV